MTLCERKPPAMLRAGPTDEDILAQAEVSHRIDGPERVEPLARSAQFDVATRKVIVELTFGATFKEMA